MERLYGSAGLGVKDLFLDTMVADDDYVVEMFIMALNTGDTGLVEGDEVLIVS